MDPSSASDDSFSEKLQEVPSARSFKPAKSFSQATKFPSQSEQQGENGGEVPTYDPAKLDLTPESPEAVDTGAQADIEVGGHAPVDDIRDDVSISSLDLEMQRERQPNDFSEEHRGSLVEGYKRQGTKFARAAAIYTEGLENRVGVLERELLELQYKVGSKERHNEERQVLYTILNFGERRVRFPPNSLRL